MIHYCENCNRIIEETRCFSCGRKNLREVTDEDYCYFVTLSAFYSEVFEEALKAKGIEPVCVPYYSFGVTRASAGRADSRKVYIRYGDVESAREIYEALFSVNGDED